MLGPMTWKGYGEQSTRDLSLKCSYSALEMWTHEMNVADACMQVPLGIVDCQFGYLRRCIAGHIHSA
jgi:hypothetical protein